MIYDFKMYNTRLTCAGLWPSAFLRRWEKASRVGRLSYWIAWTGDKLRRGLLNQSYHSAQVQPRLVRPSYRAEHVQFACTRQS